MSRLPVTFPDVERLVRNYLADELDALGETCTVHIGVPTDWTPASGSHIQVDWDGTPTATPPIIADASMRVVAWAANTTEAKRLAALAQGLLLNHPGGDGIASTQFLTGVLPTRDPDTRAEIASTTTRVTVRSEPVPSGS